jgi:chemotaxis protein methyltransferase CheR
MVSIDQRDFDALRGLIHGLTGIHLSDGKQTLVTGRLQRRLRALGLRSFSAYLAYVRDDVTGSEKRELINAITTNKTSFFREPHHFDFLMSTVVPEVMARARAGGEKRLRIWSAACSTGQEPWSLAIALQQSLGIRPDWDVRILASDLDTEVLRKAEEGKYSEEAITEVPRAYREAAFVREDDGMFSVAPQLRKLVTFRQINLVDRAWPVRTKFDAIFCRNVAIYFDRPTQKALFEGLASHLVPTGYLFSGHSENLHWLGDVLVPAGNTVHRLKRAGRSRRGTRGDEASPPSSRRGRSASRHGVPPLPPPPPPPQVAIHAGDVHASATRVVIRTLLGSCVAVCLYDPQKHIGGMNHFMLPEGTSEARMPACFGIQAMELLINKLMKLGADRARLVAKVFGASELRANSVIAADNAKFAFSFLQAEGIPVAAQKTGHELPLSVHFDTYTGVVQVRTVARVAEVVREERKSRSKLTEKEHAIADDITFFGGPS